MLVGLSHAEEWHRSLFDLYVNAIDFCVERFDPRGLGQVKVKVTLYRHRAEVQDTRALFNHIVLERGEPLLKSMHNGDRTSPRA